VAKESDGICVLIGRQLRKAWRKANRVFRVVNLSMWVRVKDLPEVVCSRVSNAV